MTAPIIVIKLLKPEAVPITSSGTHSDKSDGEIHHIDEKKRRGTNKAIEV